MEQIFEFFILKIGTNHNNVEIFDMNDHISKTNQTIQKSIPQVFRKGLEVSLF